MDSWFHRDGSLIPMEEATVSPLDRAYLLGDAVFTTLRTFAHRPFQLPRHVARLLEGAARAHIPCPSAEALAELVHEAVDTACRRSIAVPDWRVRITLSRGLGGAGLSTRGVTPVPPALLLQPLDHALPLRLSPLEVHLASTERVPAASQPSIIKSQSALPLVLARLEAEEAGCQEALLLNRHGRLAEATSANLFLVEQGRLLTPPLGEGILPGVTRDLLLEIAPAAGLEVSEQRLEPSRLDAASEVFLTATTHSVLPVARIDGRRWEAPGPVTRRVAQAFEAHVRSALGAGGDP